MDKGVGNRWNERSAENSMYVDISLACMCKREPVGEGVIGNYFYILVVIPKYSKTLIMCWFYEIITVFF